MKKLFLLLTIGTSMIHAEAWGQEISPASIQTPLTPDNLWMLIASLLVLLMYLGITLRECGLTQSKNAVHTLFKSIFILCMTFMVYAFLSFHMMFPGLYFDAEKGIVAGEWNGWISWGNFIGAENSNAAYWTAFLFQTTVAAMVGMIISGTLAERVKLKSFLIFITLFLAFCYPIIGSWQWGTGWLYAMGFHDLGGSVMVHGAAGAAALACVLLLGARHGKYHEDGKLKRSFLGHNMPLTVTGFFLLWIGWYGLNGGFLASPSKLPLLFVSTSLAAAAGGLSSSFTSWLLWKKFDLNMILKGILAGLVSISAGADVILPFYAVVVGIIAGILVILAIMGFERLKIDDPTGAVSVHGLCGIWGVLAVSLFSLQDSVSFLTQFIGASAVCGTTFLFSLILFALLKRFLGIRLNQEEETQGFDLQYHGVQTYPDR